MLFTEEDVSIVSRYMGYFGTDEALINARAGLSLITDQGRYDEIQYILGELQTIDAALSTLPSKMNITQVEEIKLNYGAQSRAYKREGCRLINLLSVLISLEVRYNRYGGGGISVNAF